MNSILAERPTRAPRFLGPLRTHAVGCILLFSFVVSGVRLWAQQTPPVEIQSKVPELTMSFAGGDETLKFPVHNSSAHTVLEAKVVIVPSTTPLKDGEYLCDARCADSGVGVMPPGGSDDFLLRASDVGATRALVIEAALFDDGSYSGDEQSAAILATGRIGGHIEYQRIVKVVERIIRGSDDDSAAKVGRIRAKINEMPVDPDPETVAEFRARFPGLPEHFERPWGFGDSRTFLDYIKSAAAGQKRVFLQYLDQFVDGKSLHFVDGQYVTDPSLVHWWEWVKKTMAA